MAPARHSRTMLTLQPVKQITVYRKGDERVGEEPGKELQAIMTVHFSCKHSLKQFDELWELFDLP